jgi:hypothetical protein
MATLTPIAPDVPVAVPEPRRRAAVLTAGCDGYRAGTTGVVAGDHDGCVVFAPDRPEDVARWATARSTLLVPPSMVLTLS